MPLSNGIIIRLNEITGMVVDKRSLGDLEAAEIKRIFLEILGGGEFYDVDEIEAWLQNEGSWKSKQVRMRLVNISHYAQSRHEQANRFRMIPDGSDSCSCES